MNPLHIFRPGQHTAQSGQTLEFTAADLAATAAAYDPAVHEAPLVVGHPATDDPAYGWVGSLAATAAGLEATPRQVDPEFAELVNAERFNRISASFYLPDAPANPAPGVYYLRHVGFLGAAAPAVKGLRKPVFDFADTAGTVVVDFALASEVSFVADPTSPAVPPAAPAENAVDYVALVQTLQDRIAQLEAELAAERDQQAVADATAFAERLVAEGRVLPADRSALVRLLVASPAESVLEFADASGQAVMTPTRDWLRGFLGRLPVQVDFAERAPAGAEAPPASADFTAPPGYAVDPAQLAAHRKIAALAQAKNIPYEQAARELR